MKRLGKYLHTTPQGLAILRLSTVPSLGWTVLDERGRPVGQVVDVFGPVASPYGSVKLANGGAPRIKSPGGEFFLAEQKQRQSKKGKYGRH